MTRTEAKVMTLTCYGTRGSYPISRPDQVNYGGNTTCFQARAPDGSDLILDGGTGLINLGRDLMAREYADGKGEAAILVSHTHWDHILGFPYFSPLRRRGNRFTFFSASQTNEHIQGILSGQHADLNFPIPFDTLSSQMVFKPIDPGGSISLRSFRCESVQLNHPGVTLGYRIESEAGTVTIYTDTGRIRRIRLGTGMGGPEPDEAFAQAYLKKLAHCARNSDLLIYDTQFFEYEMESLFFYGHSSVEDALEICRLADVKTLALSHHSPEHSDAEVERQLRRARDLAPPRLQVEAAFEGCVFAISDGKMELRGGR